MDERGGTKGTPRGAEGGSVWRRGLNQAEMMSEHV